MARTQLRTRTRRETLPEISPALIAGLIMLAEFAAFAVLSGRADIVTRSFIVVGPLLVFVARAPVVGVYGLVALIPLELFARVPNEFFSVYKLLGVLTLTSAVVHAAAGRPTIRWQRTGLHPWIGVFLFVAAASMLWSIETTLTLKAVRRLATLAIFYVLVIRLVDSRQKLRTLLWVVAGAAAVAGFFAIVAFARGQAIFDTQAATTAAGDLRAAGVSLDANFFAATILAALPICLLFAMVERSGGLRALMLVAALVIVLGTIYSYSRGGALTLAVVLLGAFGFLLGRVRGRALGAALVAAAIAVGVLAVVVPASYRARVESLRNPVQGDESIEGRWLYIQFSAESIGDTPLGVGAGGFPVAFRQSSFDQFYRYYNQSYNEDPQGRSAHNMFLEVAVEIGVIGGLVFLLVVAFALYENRRTARHLRERGSIRLRAANDAVFLGLFGFAFAGLFLSAQYEKTLWLFLALVPVLKNLAYEGEIFVPDLRKLRRALARRGRPA